MNQKRILCINDISCMGKCSLTVALPVISAMGIEAIAMPTAILSAHTVFDGFTFTDTTPQMKGAFEHFNALNEKFDAIYTGYLGSTEQIELVKNFIKKRPESLIITDPVMGDNGRLYNGFDRNYPNSIRSLCECSDVIVPNLTEACFIADTPYIVEEFSNEYLNRIFTKLTALCGSAVVTGICSKEHISVCISKRGHYPVTVAQSKLIDKQFHGTGDVFASVFCGAITVGKSLKTSAKLATHFTEMCINETVNDKTARWYGLTFEPCLQKLFRIMYNTDKSLTDNYFVL